MRETEVGKFDESCVVLAWIWTVFYRIGVAMGSCSWDVNDMDE